MHEQKATGKIKLTVEKLQKKQMQLRQKLQDLKTKVVVENEVLAKQQEKERQNRQKLNAQKQ